ncbi:hypothetical protein HWV62_7577, partial [Athelia sp. TMB]
MPSRSTEGPKSEFMREELERAQQALADAERQLEDFKAREEGKGLDVNEVTQREGARAQLEAKDNIIAAQNARLEELSREAKEVAAQAHAVNHEMGETIRRQEQEAEKLRAKIAELEVRVDNGSKLLEMGTQDPNRIQPESFLVKADSFSDEDVVSLVQSLNAEIFHLA